MGSSMAGVTAARLDTNMVVGFREQENHISSAYAV